MFKGKEIESTVVTYSYACRNIVNTIKTSGHSSLEKYTSHFIGKGYERVIVWEVSWRLNKDCNVLTPSSSGHSSISFPFSWAAQPGARGTLTSNSGLQLTDFLSHPGYIIIWCPPASWGVSIRTQFNPSTVKVIPRYLRPDASDIYKGAFLIWQLGRVGGQYVTQSRLFNSSWRFSIPNSPQPFKKLHLPSRL